MRSDAKQANLATIPLRNLFYRDAYRRVALILIILFFINCGLVVAVAYKHFTKPQPQFFAISPDGHMLLMPSLTTPSVSEQTVLQFATNGVQQAFSLDYAHWQQQLSAASQYFTADGYTSFVKALRTTNNLDTLLKYKMVSSARLLAAPQIISKGIVDGHYSWKVAMPLGISFASDGEQAQDVILNVVVIIVRMPIRQYPSQIAINSFMPQIVRQS